MEFSNNNLSGNESPQDYHYSNESPQNYHYNEAAPGTGRTQDRIEAASGAGRISAACIALNTFGSKKAKKSLPLDFQPNDSTVILGRGPNIAECSGNQRLKLIVQGYLRQYCDAPDKLGKSTIVSTVVDIVKKASPIAAFVKYDNKNGRWVDVGERTSREKVGSMFRDFSGNYKSSAKSKTAIRAAQKEKVGSHPTAEDVYMNAKLSPPGTPKQPSHSHQR